MQVSGSKQRAVRIANELLKRSPVFVDTETTGVRSTDVVIEIAVLDGDGNRLLDTLVKSEKPIPSGATAIHGISDISLIGAPSWREVWHNLEKVLNGMTVGFYNASFDLRLIRQTCGLNGIRWEQPFLGFFCVMELFAEYYGDWDSGKNAYNWKSLDFAGKFFKLPEPNAHRAREDALLTKLVFEAMTKG